MTRHYHFIGIGGVGMGPLAMLIKAKGYEVSGSDLKENVMTATLKEQGITVYCGHDARYTAGADFVVYSSAVNEQNPEWEAARSRGIPLIKRAALLADLSKQQVCITIAGAHGKTTTTSMISTLLIKAGLKPTTAIGGVIKGTRCQTATLGDGKYFVAEVDESDGSFLYFQPHYSVVTNIDYEHLDYYGNWDNIMTAYQRFIEQTDPSGCVIACGDDSRLRELVKRTPRNFMMYGLSSTCDIWAQNIRTQGFMTRFDCMAKSRRLAEIQLILPGLHNVQNALACVSIGMILGIDLGIIVENLTTHQGVNRRFQVRARVNGITVIDDYGHHPTEITATLQAARTLQKDRIIIVFQPHRYSRTFHLFEDFAACLQNCDKLIVTDIYAASEQPLPGVSGQGLCERIRQRGHRDAEYLPKGRIFDRVKEVVQPGDLVLFLGAGDIYQVGEKFAEYLNTLYGEPSAVAGKHL